LQNAPFKAIATHQAQEKLAKETAEQLQHPKKIGKYLSVNEIACSDIPEDAAEKIAAELLAFFHDRLKVQLKDSGIRHDVINAVVANNDDDLVRIVARAKALQAFLATDDGANLLAGYKRAANILSIEEKKDKASYDQPVDHMLLDVKQEEEGALANALVQADASLKADMEKEVYAEAMRALSRLRAPVDSFFDKVMVNVPEKEVRTNRLRLLSNIRQTIHTVADFGKIEG
ncbi:MAG: DALR anticodon-binding domain-containing protein, partial [Alphaproteobacteria bacterium]|nr:DALR anticodon-binding domain-containing protein [Alphaproteobacteria bacterium]